MRGRGRGRVYRGRSWIKHRRVANRHRRVRLQFVDAAERQEATANSFGQVDIAIPFPTKGCAQNMPQLGLHGAAVASRTHAQLLLERWINVADCQCCHRCLLPQDEYNVGVVSNACKIKPRKGGRDARVPGRHATPAVETPSASASENHKSARSRKIPARTERLCSRPPPPAAAASSGLRQASPGHACGCGSGPD